MSKKILIDPKTGIHRAKLWEIGFYALNNTSTNLTFVIFGSIAFYLTGIVGVSTVIAGTIATVMRMWDGVTDPLIGYLVDKTNTRFGKNRPFILIGNIIQFVGAGLIFLVIPNIPEGLRFIAYILFYMFYIIGYTFQTVVTKSAQSCLTNDPKQRPVFTMFDTVFNLVVFSLIPLYSANVLLVKHGGFGAARFNPEYYVELWLTFGAVSFILAIFAIIGLWRKDRSEFYGTGIAVKVGFKDYWEVIKNNRAIQMLVIAASSDKLFLSIQSNAIVMVMLFGIVVGNEAQLAQSNAVMGIPTGILSVLVIYFVATKMGQRKALLVGTYGAMAGALALGALFLLGDPTTLDFFFTNGLTMFTLLFILFNTLMKVMTSMSGGIVIPMTADCADYEVYRSGKYVPGLMGTLFSFIDKMISAFATTIVAVLVALIGFTDNPPTADTPYSDSIFYMALFCFVGVPMFGWIANIISMKFYPLTKEKMEEIQTEIYRIKQENLKKNN